VEKIVGMSEEDYNKWDALRSSDIKLIRESLYKFKHKKEEPDKDHLIFGRAVHCAILEPDLFEGRFAPPFSIQRPEGNAATKEENGGCKEAYQEWKIARGEYIESQKGKSILDSEQWEGVNQIRDNIYVHAPAHMKKVVDVLMKSEKEVGYRAEIANGVYGKAKPDAIIDEIGLDVKTSNSSDFKRINNSIEKWGTNVQGAYHAMIAGMVEGRNIKKITYLYAESSPPWRIHFKILNSTHIDLGESEIMWALDDYIKFKENPSIASPWMNREFADMSEPSTWYSLKINDEADARLRCAKQ
jgi:hypothetical protein